MWKVNAVTRAARVPAPKVSVLGVLMGVGSPWRAQRCFHLGCSCSMLCSSAGSVAAASCFDTWLR